MGTPLLAHGQKNQKTDPPGREHIGINEGWKFMRYTTEPDSLMYDERPAIVNRNDNIVADTRANETNQLHASKKRTKRMDTAHRQ